jgi:hypothetical protein
VIRSKALVVLTRQIHHTCPYDGHSTILALCYIKSQNINERDFCYGCTHVTTLKRKFGLRTFEQKIVLSRCKHCDEAPSVHSSKAPHLCERDPRCPGFEPCENEGRIFVALDQACTEWMVVDVKTGERIAYWDHLYNRKSLELTRHPQGRRPLIGAPGTVPPDALDSERNEAATFAERKRRSVYLSNDERRALDTDAPSKPRRGRRKKTI